MALPPSVDLLAEIQFGVMARSLAIAAVVVAPFAWVMRRRVMRRRAALAPDIAPPEPAAPTLEAVIDEIHRMGETRGADARLTLRVPHGVTIDGDPAPPPVVDAIVRDALSRSGLVPTAELDTGDARVIECSPTAATPATD